MKTPPTNPADSTGIYKVCRVFTTNSTGLISDDPANFANSVCEVCGKYFANSADFGRVCEVCGTHIFMNASSIKSGGN